MSDECAHSTWPQSPPTHNDHHPSVGRCTDDANILIERAFCVNCVHLVHHAYAQQSWMSFVCYKWRESMTTLSFLFLVLFAIVLFFFSFLFPANQWDWLSRACMWCVCVCVNKHCMNCCCWWCVFQNELKSIMMSIVWQWIRWWLSS